MMFSRTRFLSSDGAMNQGAAAVSVAANMASRARESSYQRPQDLRSTGVRFQVLRSSVKRAFKRRVCSSRVQKPITRSTPARLYPLRWKIVTSPAAGRCGRWRWVTIWLLSRAVGADKAMTWNTRGLTRSVIALIVPHVPHLPAPSRPSKTVQTFGPL
jgi:hypothetical protein